MLAWLALAQLLQDDDEGLRARAATYTSTLASRVKGGALLGSAIEVSRGVEFCFEFLSRSFASQDVLLDHFVSVAEQIAEGMHVPFIFQAQATICSCYGSAAAAEGVGP